MDYLVSIISKLLGVKLLKKIIYIGLMSIFFVATLSMWSSFVIAFFFFLNKIQLALSMLSYSGSDTSILKFFGLLNCIGVIDAFNETKSVWLSGITFIVARIMFIQTTRSYLNMLRLFGSLIT